MNIKQIIKEEIEEFDWIEDVDPDNVHISDLEIGMTVMVNCPKHKSLRNRELMVDFSFYPRKPPITTGEEGEITMCFHFKAKGIRNPGAIICEPMSCNFKLINKEINESDDMDWINDVPDNLNGIKFITDKKTKRDEPSKVYTIRDAEISPRRNIYQNYITVLWSDGEARTGAKQVRRKTAYSNFQNGKWIVYDEKINESDDMEWIRDVSGNLQIGDYLIDHNGKKWSIIEIEPATSSMTLHNPLVKAKRYGLKGVYDIFTKKNIVDKISKGLWKLIPNPNINESDDMQWMEDVPDYKLPEPWKWLSDDDMYDILYTKGYVTNTMTQITMVELAHNYGYRWSKKHGGWYDRDEIEILPDIDGEAYYTINESDDMEWIEDIDIPQVGDTYKYLVQKELEIRTAEFVITNIIPTPLFKPFKRLGYVRLTDWTQSKYVIKYRIQGNTEKYDYEIYLDDFLTGVEEGLFVKIKEINEQNENEKQLKKYNKKSINRRRL